MQATNSTAYKQAQRARDKAAGNKTITINLTADEVQKLELGRRLRNAGGEPYQAGEYLALLLENDAAALVQQMKAIKPCKRCGRTLPETCHGDNKAEAACFLNRAYRQLALTKLTCQKGEFDSLLTDYRNAGGKL
ncbi:hypothetical protein J8N54_001672 [Salmonella enterica]|nr:hypothetical protein [Salmonella enterica]EBN1281128.1 hypothetical protein [Salmonella enterica]EBR6994653.1 hypothetical protein [Salmonella enterica]EHH5781187.1 hypothetical protein [Salmonella enterica]